MKKIYVRKFIVAACFLTAFLLWTALLKFVDVKPIGPNGSEVGFSDFNGRIRDLVGTDMTMYTVTDWAGILPIVVCFCFAVVGFVQLVKRKSLIKVDYDLLILGGFYIFVAAVYLIFEKAVVNYRPVLINGYLEASYPSSTTTLAICIMPTAAETLKRRIKNKTLLYLCVCFCFAFTAFMVAGRVISGVHWASDIIGGVLFSVGADFLYSATCDCVKYERLKKTERNDKTAAEIKE